jgi:hypothetical protein
MALADTFDAMVSDRPYRAGLPQEQAMDIIRKEAGHQFDPSVVDSFNQIIGGRKGVVLLEALPEFFSSPLIITGSTSSPTPKHSGSKQEGKPC